MYFSQCRNASSQTPPNGTASGTPIQNEPPLFRACQTGPYNRHLRSRTWSDPCAQHTLATSPNMSHLELDRIVQRYGSHTVVDGVSFRIATGSIACLLGPSGCGKTTLLGASQGSNRSLKAKFAWRERRSAAGIQFAARKATHRHGFPGLLVVPAPHHRREYRLRTGFAARAAAHRACRSCWPPSVLTGQEDQYPHELSGGQQQRVALARAPSPRVRNCYCSTNRFPTSTSSCANACRSRCAAS